MNCKVCGIEIPKGRLLAIPGTQTCVNHSSAEKKVGKPILLGDGDHTCVELNIMEADEYKRLEKMSSRSRNPNSELGS